jgi:hypothetical protein
MEFSGARNSAEDVQRMITDWQHILQKYSVFVEEFTIGPLYTHAVAVVNFKYSPSTQLVSEMMKAGASLQCKLNVDMYILRRNAIRSHQQL